MKLLIRVPGLNSPGTRSITARVGFSGSTVRAEVVRNKCWVFRFDSPGRSRPEQVPERLPCKPPDGRQESCNCRRATWESLNEDSLAGDQRWATPLSWVTRRGH